MKYEIVASEYSESLETMVNQRLSEGWTLQGGVSIGVNPTDHGYHWYVQAMVKADD